MPVLFSPLKTRRLLVAIAVLTGLVVLPSCTAPSEPDQADAPAVEPGTAEDTEEPEEELVEESIPVEPASPFDFASSSVLTDEDGYSYELSIEVGFATEVGKDITHEKPGFATGSIALEHGAGTLTNLTPEREANPTFVVSPFQVSAVYPASSPVCGLEIARGRVLKVEGEPCFIEIATAAALFDQPRATLGVGEVKALEVGVFGHMMKDYNEGVLGDNVVRFRGIPEAEWDTYVEAIQNPAYVTLALGLMGEIVSPVLCERLIDSQTWTNARDPRILASSGPMPVCG